MKNFTIFAVFLDVLLIILVVILNKNITMLENNLKDTQWQKDSLTIEVKRCEDHATRIKRELGIPDSISWEEVHKRPKDSSIIKPYSKKARKRENYSNKIPNGMSNDYQSWIDAINRRGAKYRDN